MPELAEVEYHRKRWNPGLNQKILRMECHPRARVLRGVPADELVRRLTGARFLHSEAHGKQMRFLFSGGVQLGLHLGMTGALRLEKPDVAAQKHDHLVLRQKERALIFTDPRMFGRVLFFTGKEAATWWKDLPPEILSPGFTVEYVMNFFRRRRGAPLKAVLLMQECFPGVGNWMADEILWRSRFHPAKKAGSLSPAQAKTLWKEIRRVSERALKTIGETFCDPPKSWLFLHRWEKGGHCPRCSFTLDRQTIGGRTTCWCPRCQTPD